MRFYGGTPRMWAAEISMRTVRAYAAEQDKLIATESLLAFERIATGTGSIGDMGKEILRKWERERGVDDTPAKPRVHRTAAELRAMGIKVYGPPAQVS